VSGPFAVDDFDAIGRLTLDAWGSAVDRDWSVPAGTLEWSCWRTADHTVDCVFSYAFMLATRRQHAYPNFSEIHAPDGAPPQDLVDGLGGACELLRASIVAAPAGTTAIFGYDGNLQPLVGDGGDFAARGAHELILHAHDVCTGLGVAFEPTSNACERLLDHTAGWPRVGAVTRIADPWSDLLVRSGRPARNR